MDFSARLLKWYPKHRRDLPWRNTTDPYKVWLSEVILQQTRVQQGLPYYERFIAAFPTATHLANASEDKVLKLWQGLGYYSRARNLHHAAKTIRDNYKGQFPKNYKEIRSLKGVGDYTAAAIASFCFGQPYPVVDGNVYRVLARVFGLGEAIDSHAGKKQFHALATELLNRQRPGEYNQAIMEFGAVQCLPRNPDCVSCIFNKECMAFAKGKVESLPVKAKKVRQRNRYFNYLVIRDNGSLYLQKRTGRDIWENLYEFPLIESKRPVSEERLVGSKSWAEILGNAPFIVTHVSVVKKHLLSHQRIHARFWEIEASGNQTTLSPRWLKVSRKELSHYAVPRLIEAYLNGF